MKSSTQLRRTPNLAGLLIPLMFTWLTPSFTAQGVNPPPDGGYPNGNTAEGQSALFGLATGGYNTAMGFLSLATDTNGGFNTAVGAGTLFLNTATGNTATGAAALLQNTSGESNTANGAFALFGNTAGISNTAVGDNALYSNSTGSGNIAIGYNALGNNIDGSYNIAIGYNALTTNIQGSGNILIGTNGGYQTGASYDNILIGRGAPTGNAERNIIRIGNWDSQYAAYCFINGIWGAPSGEGLPVQVRSDGYLTTVSSSRRFKKQIEPMKGSSEAILGLRPVTFKYKSDETDRQQFGLIAEEVEKVNRDLVVRDKEGKPCSVRYDQVNAMLLNEFLKEHKKVQDLEARVAQQQKEMAVLTASIKEQAAQIQKVSAELGMKRQATKVALK